MPAEQHGGFVLTSSHLLLLAALLRKNSNYKNVADWIGLLKQPLLVRPEDAGQKPFDEVAKKKNICTRNKT